MIDLSPVQLGNILLSGMIIASILGRVRYNHMRRTLDYPSLYWIASVAIHMTIFYTATGLNNSGVIDLPHANSWSSVLRAHELMTLLAIQTTELYRAWRGNKEHG